jgi:hypothetical protein
VKCGLTSQILSVSPISALLLGDHKFSIVHETIYTGAWSFETVVPHQITQPRQNPEDLYLK